MVIAISSSELKRFLEGYAFSQEQGVLLDSLEKRTNIEHFTVNGRSYPMYINEYWTARQRQANSLHEIAYRACFKPQLPRFFIDLLTIQGDIVYDPFAGRGTTAIEAAIMGRSVISNDITPLSKILTYPRLLVPPLDLLESRLKTIGVNEAAKAEMDLSMFFHPRTEAEIVSLKQYLSERRDSEKEDDLDWWVRMVATNRLTGHSSGFFSVYTLPPNQAVSPESQKNINEKRNQSPPYRDTKRIILKKSIQLLQDVSQQLKNQLRELSRTARFITKDARFTEEIQDACVSLTVTSPPFLDTVQYADDNWLRCWFNKVDAIAVSKNITMSRTTGKWSDVMGQVFKELYRVTKPDGWVAFEVGEVRGGKVLLDEYVVPLGLSAGFECEGVLVNQQKFTKTANIWGIGNNSKGTNSNRIVLFRKE